MIEKEDIYKLIKEKIEKIGGFIVDIDINNNNNKILIEVDKPEGIHVDECSVLGRHIRNNIDIDDYSMQVSSPGAGRPFKVKEQYLKSLDKNVQVELKDGISIQGKLLEIEDNQITVEENIKKKQAIKHKISFENIKKTKRMLSFK